MTTEAQKRDTSPWVWGGLVFAAWLASPWFLRWMVSFWTDDTGALGTFGDSYGALTSLFTGQAFVGLIITLRQQKRQIELQRVDLALQRKEMKASRKELAGQKEQMALQNESIRQQMFEQTFFNLLGVFGDHRSQIQLSDTSAPVVRSDLEPGSSGLTKFTILLERVLERRSMWGEDSSQPDSTPEELQAEAIARHFLSSIDRHLGAFDRYLLHVLNLIAFVDDGAVNNKTPYFDVLRAQLSASELILIAAHCELPRNGKLKRVADEYELFRYLPNDYSHAPIALIRREIFKQSRQLGAEES